MKKHDLLVTAEDVKNELNIDLLKSLNAQPAYVDNWLKRVQRTILNFVAGYAYGGNEQVQRYLQSERNRQVFHEAIIEQIEYLARNKFMQPLNLMTVRGEYAAPSISPIAKDILENAGLLYAGAGGALYGL